MSAPTVPEPITQMPTRLMRHPEDGIHVENDQCSTAGCVELGSDDDEKPTVVDRLRAGHARYRSLDRDEALLFAQLEGCLNDLDAPAGAHDLLDSLLRLRVEAQR